MRLRPIRAIVICVVRHGDRLFVSEDVDRITGNMFYRPLGGGIEHGERSCDAVVRELREEIGAEIADVRCLGMLETMYPYNDQLWHEVVIVYEARFVDTSLYEREHVQGWDGEEGKDPFVARWQPLHLFAEGRALLYPYGLLELLRGEPHAAIVCRNAATDHER